MTNKKRTTGKAWLQQVFEQDADLAREAIRRTVQEVLEEEMTELLGAAKSARTGRRSGYRSGYYERALMTRVGRIELRVPQDREGRFSTAVFERYQRTEKALVAAMAEMYFQGVSTRKVKAVTEELCGYSVSAGTISNLVAKLDTALQGFAQRDLEEPFRYVILDARYERVRQADGVPQSQAVLLALGVDEDGRRQVLGVELAQRESRSSWKEFLLGLKQRGLAGVESVVSDDHAGLRRAVQEVLPEAVWQRCSVHFLRNALDHMPRKRDDDCLQELRWLYDRRDQAEARRDLAAWLQRWQERYPELTDWVEEHIEETFPFYRLPRQHHKHMQSTNMLERFNGELRRRTQVIRIFPNAASCLRLIRALAVETHERWLEENRYLNMEYAREQHKELLRQAA